MPGLEAAAVDNRELDITSLRPGDARTHLLCVAGPAALLVAKFHKLGERHETPHRLLDKDAHDLYRLRRRIETDELVDGFALVLAHDRSRAVAAAGLV